MLVTTVFLCGQNVLTLLDFIQYWLLKGPPLIRILMIGKNDQITPPGLETQRVLIVRYLRSSAQLPGASLASVEILLTNLKNWLQTENKQTDSGVYRVAPATKNYTNE